MDHAESTGAKGNLLVIEDDLSARQTLEGLLTREGYEVRLAPNGRTGLMFAEEDPPELILLGIRLSDLDGYEVCRILKQHGKTREIPVIFLTAIGDVRNKVKGFEAGGVDCITKPFHVGEVLARVGGHLELKRAAAALHRTNQELEDRVAGRTVELEDRLRFERLISDLSARFVNIAAEETEAEITTWLKRIAELFEVDRCNIGLFSEDGAELVRAFEYHARDAEPGPESLSKESAPWYFEQLIQGKPVVIDRVEDLPAEADKERQIFFAKGMKSLLSIPVVSGGKTLGSCVLVSVRAERVWPEGVMRGFRLITEVFANALKRKQMEEQLHIRLREIEDLKQQLELENISLREEITLQYGHEEIVGRSDSMRRVLTQVEQVAPTDSTVLLQGETGTGKELVARAIHRVSARRDRILITVNCASLPPTLMESELFGREKGAYTGAMTRMVGRFETAHGATLFLDEIGELPLEVQSKLLRVLEEGRFERLGSAETIQVNVRIIAATNRDLAQDVKEGRFRKDLFYRLNVFPIVMPPLREHPEDVPLLVWAFVRQFEKKMGKRIENIPRKGMEALQRYSWPGNARELRNVIENAMIVSTGKTLEVRVPQPGPFERLEAAKLEDIDRSHILGVLEKVGWRVAGKGGAAEILGLKRGTLQSKMKKLGIKRT
jgi:formate hydrogenlyase transcriptional activator